MVLYSHACLAHAFDKYDVPITDDESPVASECKAHLGMCNVSGSIFLLRPECPLLMV